MAPKKKQAERPQENVSLGPQVREGELVFGVARIFASFVSYSPTVTSCTRLTMPI
jgi:small subunit ribosomal protein S14e